MNRKQQELAEKVYQARLRAADLVFSKVTNSTNLIKSYLEDARQEIEARYQADGKFSIYDNLPISYWKGRESLAIELLTRIEKEQQGLKEILDYLVVPIATEL